MLVQGLRPYLADGSGGNVGWLSAVADARIAAAIGAMHADPGARWTLQALAQQAGISRSSFAQRFKATVVDSPMDHLTRWRVLLAGDRLTSGGEPVSGIAVRSAKNPGAPSAPHSNASWDARHGDTALNLRSREKEGRGRSGPLGPRTR